jgi:hypothetical protein
VGCDCHFLGVTASLVQVPTKRRQSDVNPWLVAKGIGHRVNPSVNRSLTGWLPRGSDTGVSIASWRVVPLGVAKRVGLVAKGVGHSTQGEP